MSSFLNWFVPDYTTLFPEMMILLIIALIISSLGFYRTVYFISIGYAFYNSSMKWVAALIGLICVVLIRMGSTKRLEKAQNERYGALPDYQQYIRTVPLLFPIVPVYSLKTSASTWSKCMALPRLDENVVLAPNPLLPC